MNYSHIPPGPWSSFGKLSLKGVGVDRVRTRTRNMAAQGTEGMTTPVAQKPGPVRDDDDTVRKIPLRNKKREVVAYAYVDAADFEAVNAYGKWSRRVKESNEYAVSNCMSLHTFIMGTPPAKMVIDHWNGNGLDNRRCNLRFATRSLNKHNMKKVAGTVSRYVGVRPRDGKWQARIGGKHLGTFDTEIHAAYAYDVAAIEIHGPGANTNGVPKPDGWVTPEFRKHDAKGVKLMNKMYHARFKNAETGIMEELGAFKTREAARAVYNKREAEFNVAFAKAHAAKPITKNADGIAYLMAGNVEVLVSDEDWHEVTKHKWSCGKMYPITTISGEPIRMHKFLMGEKPGFIADHRNGVKSDNRRSNLRWADSFLNGHNQKSRGGKLYKGTMKYGKNRFTAQIVVKRVRYVLGDYPTEVLAALSYNYAARHFYGEHAYQNDLPDDPGYVWDLDKFRLVPRAAA